MIAKKTIFILVLFLVGFSGRLSAASLVAEAGLNQQVRVGAVVTLSGTRSMGTISSYQWDFGDGSQGSGETVTHIYNKVGTYVVTLTVANKAGETATDKTIITVTDVPPPPDADKISFSETEAGDLVVTGGPGAVEGGSTVVLENNDTGEKRTTGAGADGSFTLTVPAASKSRSGQYDLRAQKGKGPSGPPTSFSGGEPLPQITSAVPRKAKVWDEISLYGSGFEDGVKYCVLFPGPPELDLRYIVTTAGARSSTELKVQVPLRVVRGMIRLLWVDMKEKESHDEEYFEVPHYVVSEKLMIASVEFHEATKDLATPPPLLHDDYPQNNLFAMNRKIENFKTKTKALTEVMIEELVAARMATQGRRKADNLAGDITVFEVKNPFDKVSVAAKFQLETKEWLSTRSFGNEMGVLQPTEASLGSADVEFKKSGNHGKVRILTTDTTRGCLVGKVGKRVVGITEELSGGKECAYFDKERIKLNGVRSNVEQGWELAGNILDIIIEVWGTELGGVICEVLKELLDKQIEIRMDTVFKGLFYYHAQITADNLKLFEDVYPEKEPKGKEENTDLNDLGNKLLKDPEHAECSIPKD